MSLSNHRVLLEYVWIDSLGETRSKIKIAKSSDIFPPLPNKQTINTSSFIHFVASSTIGLPTANSDTPHIENIPIWNFDGSSTGQAVGHESDIILRPVRLYANPFYCEDDSLKMKAFIVLCECYNKDYSAHKTNSRYTCAQTTEKVKEHHCLFGIEQEYVLFSRKRPDKTPSDYVMFEQIVSNDKDGDKACDKDNPDLYCAHNCTPYKWTDRDDPGKGAQGPYYCSVGGDKAFGRDIVTEHMLTCLKAGVELCGTNAEVMASQWEFQIGTCDPLKVCDDLIIARYILHRISEKYGCWASLHPKPYKGDWNGSGGHTNFSTYEMRQPGGFKFILEACERLRGKHIQHIEVYGHDNHLRLTGAHETASISEFSWGVGNRGCSVRIPLQVLHNGSGYLEDRRPASNCDPYLVTEIIMRTVCICESDNHE